MAAAPCQPPVQPPPRCVPSWPRALRRRRCQPAAALPSVRAPAAPSSEEAARAPPAERASSCPCLPAHTTGWRWAICVGAGLLIRRGVVVELLQAPNRRRRGRLRGDAAIRCGGAQIRDGSAADSVGHSQARPRPPPRCHNAQRVSVADALKSLWKRAHFQTVPLVTAASAGLGTVRRLLALDEPGWEAMLRTILARLLQVLQPLSPRR